MDESISLRRQNGLEQAMERMALQRSGRVVIGRALVLNATYEPIGVVSSRRALVLCLCARADLVHKTESNFHTTNAQFPEPSVVRLRHYVRIPRQSRMAITRRSVFIRDGHCCQYCGAAAENIDHVVPRSRGGQHCWENVVACCRRCNSAKGDRYVEDTGLILSEAPRAPRSRIWLLAASGNLRSEWMPYLVPGSGIGIDEAVGL